MKIAMVGHKRVPSREGGIEVVVEELSTRMVALGNEVTLYNRKGHHVAGAEYDIKPIEGYKGVKIKYVPTIERRGLAAVTSSFFGCLFAAVGHYDVVHVHAEGPAKFCWIPKIFGKKVVVTIHGLDWQRSKWGNFASRYILSGEKSAVKHADQIIVLSKGVQDYFTKRYNRATVYIPNGVNRPVVLPADEIKRKWGLEKNSYILFVGRIVPEKGIKYLLKAWELIKTDKKLVLAGSPSDTQEFNSEVHKLADDRVLFTGFTQGKALEELYSNAYLYVLPSDLEGMPLTLLEAMSYGNCCLTSDISECTEVVEDKAVTFHKSDTRDLKNKMQYLISESAVVERYKATACDFICNKYNWNDTVIRTLETYREK